MFGNFKHTDRKLDRKPV